MWHIYANTCIKYLQHFFRAITFEKAISALQSKKPKPSKDENEKVTRRRKYQDCLLHELYDKAVLQRYNLKQLLKITVIKESKKGQGHRNW